MAKWAKTLKIPRNLSDKDMFAGYVEEETIEDKLLKAAAAEDKKRREREAAEPKLNIALAGFTPELTEALGKELLKLKMELFRDGVKDYTIKLKREGQSIVLTPAENKGK